MALADKDGRELYAVAIEQLDRRGQPVAGGGRMFHINAHDAAEAKIHFQTLFPDRRKHRVVGAALAIGFFVEDKHGMKLSAT